MAKADMEILTGTSGKVSPLISEAPRIPSPHAPTQGSWPPVFLSSLRPVADVSSRLLSSCPTSLNVVPKTRTKHGQGRNKPYQATVFQGALD